MKTERPPTAEQGLNELAERCEGGALSIIRVLDAEGSLHSNLRQASQDRQRATELITIGHFLRARANQETPNGE